jgi:hypothetical protein
MHSSTYLVKFISERKVLKIEVGKENGTYVMTDTSSSKVCNLPGNCTNINTSPFSYYWPMLDNNGRNVESLCKITYLPMT